ncbi:acyltransferase family protein [Paenibacillus elgii]|uniref:acyltransferase family protein n=1 Tax=Paenibacillus elgii TaxID=189691 RepID=UPI0020420DCD|nr:acyltransferase [Paenibacillus elgii]MCM3272352.1 acyltransferase [Paenibacillus elgii]
MISTNIKYLPALDHIRAIAAILILMFHGQQLFTNKFLFNDVVPSDFWITTKNPLFSIIFEGHTAVALFMVLSGFVFTYGALGYEVNYGLYIRNRLLRIYPLFVFLIFVGIYIFRDKFSFLSMLQSLLTFSNITGALEIGPFSSMFWAISVEFQFYLIFPFLLVFFQKEGSKYLIMVICLAIMFRVVAFSLGSNVRDVSYWTILGRIDQFVIGMLTAKIFIETKLGDRFWRMILPISVLATILLLFVFNNLGGWPVIKAWKIIWPTVEGLFWAVFLLSYSKLIRENSNWVLRTLSKIGEISFSIYLLHFIVLQILLVKGWYFSFNISPLKNAFINSFFILMPVTILMAVFSYNTIEKPFLQMRRRYLSERK